MAKQVSLAEEYLGDHFPGFPVLPGVMMLEAAVQAAAWLVRSWDQFSHSVIVLQAARGIRYGSFVEPGHSLIVQANAMKLEEHRSDFKIRGTVNGVVAIQGRIELAHLNLADQYPALGKVDHGITDELKRRWQSLTRTDSQSS